MKEESRSRFRPSFTLHKFTPKERAPLNVPPIPKHLPRHDPPLAVMHAWVDVISVRLKALAVTDPSMFLCAVVTANDLADAGEKRETGR